MQIARSTAVAIYIAIFLSLSSREIEATSGNPRTKEDHRLTVNLDDLVIEVTAPRGREGVLNTEPFYERWQNVDDVAYWESIYGSADNIPEFEDLPEIAGETFELKYAGESENESSNAEDNKTPDIGCSKPTIEKNFPPNEVAVPKGRKNLSSDRCERINPLYPARRSTVRQTVETSPKRTREESEAGDPKRVARTLSLLRESGRSRSKSGFNYNHPEHYCPCNKHGRCCYRPYGFGYATSSPCDRPEDDSAVGWAESVGLVDSAINAESVNANSGRCNGARVVADAVGHAGGQLPQTKRDAIDLGPVGSQAIGLGSVNNAGAARLEEGVNSGEAHVDGGLYIVGNSVLDTNSGIINADTGTADGIESAADGETRAAGVDTAVGTPVDNDVDEVELEEEQVAAKLEEEANGEANTDSEVSTELNSKLAGEEGLQGETEVAKNSPVIFDEAESGVSGEAPVVPEEDYSKSEETNDDDQTRAELVGATLEENKEGVTEIPSDVEEEGPVVVEDEKLGNGEKSSGEEIVGSTLRINSDDGAESRHSEETSDDHESEDLSCECRSSSEEDYCYPRAFYSRLFYDERPLQGHEYHEESKNHPEYRRKFPAGHRHHASTGIHAHSNTGFDVNAYLRAAEVPSGPHAHSGIQTSLEEDMALNTDEPEFGVSGEAPVLSDEDYSKSEETNDVDRVGSTLEKNKEGVTESPSDVEEEGPVVVEDEKLGNGEKSSGEEIVGSTLRINSDDGAESRHGEDASDDHQSEDLSCECRSSSEEDYCYPRAFYSRRFYDEGRLQGHGYHEESKNHPEYRRKFPAGHRHHASTGIHAHSNTGFDVNAYVRAIGVPSGPHTNSGIQTSLEEDMALNTDEPEFGVSGEAPVLSDEDYSKSEETNDVDRVYFVGATLEENKEDVSENPLDVEEEGPVVVEDEKLGNGEKSSGEETVGSTLRINSFGGAESRHSEETSDDHESEDLSCECRSSSEEDYCYPRAFYSRRFYDERPLQGHEYHEESKNHPEYRRKFPAGHRHHASTGIHAHSNTGFDVNAYLHAVGVSSGPHANSGIQTSLEDVAQNTDATAGHSRSRDDGSSDVGASRFSVRDGKHRDSDEQPVDAASSEYEEYDEEPEIRFPENPSGDESSSYHGIKSGIRGDSGIRTSFDTEFEINSGSAAGGLQHRAKSYPGRESHLDIWPVTFGVNGPNPPRLRDVINSGIRADGGIHSSHDSRLDVNAGGHSHTGAEPSPDLDSHLDIRTEGNRASAAKLGEKICESACGGISDSGETHWPDSRSDEAYDGRSEYPGEESLEIDGESEAAYHICDNCRRELYGGMDGGSCPICGRFGDRPGEERRRYLLTGTIHHFDGPIQATAGAESTRSTRHLNYHINLDANCTGEVASHSLDCQGMDHDLQTPRDGNPVPLRSVRTHLSHGHDIAVDMHDRARSLVAGGLHPRDHTASMLSFYHSKVPDDLVKLNEESEITLFGTKLLQHQLSVDYNITPNSFIEFLNNHGFRVTGDGICRGRRKRCGGHDKFRNLDGSCNNFDNPTWGQSNRAFARILPPRYSDGIHGMPVSVTGADLPNPRKLSVSLYSRRSNLDPELTLAVVQWGQTLAHDLARQVMDQTSKGGIECCGENGKRQLPKSLQHHSCAPISISPRDKFYSRHGQRCMNFVRSMTVAREDCTLGPADQLNGATSFLDCSPMYGVDKATSDELREFVGGRMKVEFRSGRWMLPTVRNHSNVCDIWTSDDVCYRSGDPRNNQNPQLVILQTLLVREHNRIADGLSALNLNWTDERIFQESRRIVIAEYQHITYNEWLPLVLGKRYVRRHGIVRTKPGMSRVYNELVDPSTIIGFTSGAFRSLHSMIEGELGLCDAKGNFVHNLRLSDHYFRPRIIEKGSNFEHLLRGLTAQRMQKQNMHLHTELTEYLFRSYNDYGMDLAAIDIQRGRDHGVPGYNAYRKICRLRPAQDFDDLSEEISWENIEKLRRDYAHVDDIDLIVGATMEKRITGSQFGPTNRCLIGEQFYRSRMGDRYFYDNEKFCRSFTPEQFDEITKVTLSRLICDMGGDVDDVQRYAFRATSLKNPLVPCEDLPKLDLKYWIE